MRLSNALAFILLAVAASFLMMPYAASAQEDTPTETAPEQEEEQAAPLPGLSELVAIKTELNVRLGALEKEIAELPDYADIESSLSQIQSNLDDIKWQLEKLIFSKSYSYQKFDFLKDRLNGESNLIKKSIKPLEEDLSKFESIQLEWLNEKERWSAWGSSYAKDESTTAAEPIFEETEETISKALGLISDTLKHILAIREEAGNLRASINSIKADVAAASPNIATSLYAKTADPMYSPQYYSQFDGQLFEDFQKRLPFAYERELKLARQTSPSALFILSLLLVLSTGLILRYRRELAEVEQLRFIAARPYSTGLFISFFVVVASHELGVSEFLKSIFVIVFIGITLTRLLSQLKKDRWLTRLLSVSVIFLFLIRLLPFMDIPLPLYRLVIFGLALGAFLYLTWYQFNVNHREQSLLNTWTARICTALLLVVLAAEILGYSSLARYVFSTLIITLILFISIWIFKMIFSGLLELAVRSSAIQRIEIVRDNTPEILGLLTNIVNLILLTFLVAQLLELWTYIDSPYAGLIAILSFGFTWGPIDFNVGLILFAAILFYGSFIISSILGGVLDEAIFKRRGIDRGVRASYRIIIKYVFVIAGFLLALRVLGFDLRNIAIFGGALGIGIGFGLQNVVNNFVSGIIMLFERPVKVGDIVTVDGEWGEIKKIGLRSTVLKKFDYSDLVVPNSSFTSEKITNWTLSDRYVRLTVPVGIAYGSDIPLVMKTLSEVAESNSRVLKNPEPQILFRNFGESSLDFELRAWVQQFDDRLGVESELRRDIDLRFREAAIVIAFPQRDLHLISVPDTPVPKPTASEAEQSFQAPSGNEGAEDHPTSEDTDGGE